MREAPAGGGGARKGACMLYRRVRHKEMVRAEVNGEQPVCAAALLTSLKGVASRALEAAAKLLMGSRMSTAPWCIPSDLQSNLGRCGTILTSIRGKGSSAGRVGGHGWWC
jgi:hypothetical protein